MKYLLILLLTLLTACGAPPPPPSAPTLPRLESPTLTVPTTDTRNILIPRSALVERAGLPGVFVVSTDNQARFRLVRPGKIHDNKIEILSGLRGGEVLVTGDLGAVRDGSPIVKPE